MKTFSRVTTLATAAVLSLGMIGGMAPANAARGEAESGSSNSEVEMQPGIPVDQIDPNSVAGKVNSSTSRAEAESVLVANGFQEKAAGSGIYEKTEAGLTVGFNLNEGDSAGAPVAGWALVWRGVTPYLRGSIDEWQVVAEDGLAVGTAGCALISNVWGAAGCVAVGGVASNWVGRYDTSSWPANYCLAITPVNVTPRAFAEPCV